MINLTYIFHSCFSLETESCLLVFDYWMDPSNVLPNILLRNKDKHIYVLASHFHPDHFNKEIFGWKKQYKSITYILSKDILKHRRAEKGDADVWMAKGSMWQNEDMKVTATGSNDSGVSWIVNIDGKCIFHAGDLCNWYARFLSEEKESAEIVNQECEGINPLAEEKRFLGELKDIRKHTDSFDLVMFPIDGRIGNGYTLGARQFISRFRVHLLVPMHFVMSGFESAWRMEPFCTEKGILFWRIDKEGTDVALENDLTIRRTTPNDIPRLHEIFAIARAYMAKTNNPNQWAADYPSEELLREDIETGGSYVVVHKGIIVATFVLRTGIDPTYNNIYEGTWLNGSPYSTIHRIASSGEVKGILHLVMHFALLHFDNIRIDTHAENVVMQHAILKEGFQYCGIIRCWNGSERLAYQFTGD